MGLSFRSERPLHLGRYPMEKVKRVDQPTTQISDKIPRMPQRSSFFERARAGDSRPKPKREMSRLLSEYPLSGAVANVLRTQLSLHKGEVSPNESPLLDDREELARHVKALCHLHDADLVDICEIPENASYSRDPERKSPPAQIIALYGIDTIPAAVASVSHKVNCRQARAASPASQER